MPTPTTSDRDPARRPHMPWSGSSARVDACAALDLPLDATRDAVKRAFRRAALALHPDRAGEGSTAAFQRAAAAYEWLLENTDDERAPSGRGLLSRLHGRLSSLLARGVLRRLGTHRYEVRLEPDEAQSGGHTMISMDAEIVCRSCGGAQPACARCGGTGSEVELVSVWLAVPTDCADGHELRASIRPMTFVDPPSFVAVTAAPAAFGG